jgi:putative resolvase
MPAEVTESAERKTIVYARVSSPKQRADLERQRSFLLERYPDAEVVTDVGSGINWKRPGLLSVLERAHGGTIEQVVVASRDRLCRFAFELIDTFLKLCHTDLVVLDNTDHGPEQELSDDVLSIIQVFCCRRNGKRRYTRRGDQNAVDENKTQSNKVAESGACTVQRPV